jgi:hypothetical protein
MGTATPTPARALPQTGLETLTLSAVSNNRATFGNITITNDTGNPYGVVAKVDGAGNFLWAQPLEAAVYLLANGVAVDAAGNCYVTGTFTGQATIGGIQLSNTSCPTCSGSGFVAKYTSDGNLLWATKSGHDARGIALDSAGNVFVTGNVLSTAAIWGSTHTNLSSQNSSAMFLAKYDSAGNFTWVAWYGTPGLGGDYGFAVAIGSDGGAYTAGNELGNSTETTFLFKYTASGNLVWTRFGTGGTNSGPLAAAVSVDSSNSVYVTGGYTGAANFSGTVLTGSTTSRIFVGKYNAAGNLQWVSGFGGTGGASGSGVAVTSLGDNIYFTGLFTSTATFGDFTVTTSINMQDLFLANLGIGPISNWLVAGLDGQPAGTNAVRRGPAMTTLLTSFVNGIIGYSLDGSDPRISSTLYTGPFTVSESALLRAVAYNSTFSDSVEMDAVQITILPTLTVSTAGGGTVRIDPPSGAYFSNSIAQITAQPASGYAFLQWLGDASGTHPTNTVTMSRDKYVKAVFGTAVGTIVVGAGSVSADPSLPLYPFGTAIRFTAQAQAGSYFLQWGAAASGTNNPLDFVVSTATQTVAGVFSPLAGGKFALTVVEDGRGHVLRSPLANTYNSGQTVTLTAKADAGQDFVSWSGDASGAQNPLAVTMTLSKVITANFTKRPTLIVGTQLEGLVEGGFRLTLTGEFGAQYQMLGSTNLLDWLPLGIATNSYGTVQFTDGAATNLPARFYRAVGQ